MKPIFSRRPSLQIRLLLVVVVVFVILVADSRFSAFNRIRAYLDTAVSPFYFVANAPRQLLDTLSQRLDSRSKLQQENQALRQKLLLQNSELLLLNQYKQENNRLRELLGSPLRRDEQKRVAQVIATTQDPYRDQLVIDKGSANGVHVSQPVIDNKGIVGQVVAVAKYTSRVLLVCDATHALPVQVLRNDIRTIAAGNGCNEDLTLEHLPANVDIHPGDELVTSGLGGVFPEGYPVAIVSSVHVDHQRAWAVIKAHPTAELQRLRYLLLLWGAEQAPGDGQALMPDNVHQVAQARLKQITSRPLPTKAQSERDVGTTKTAGASATRHQSVVNKLTVSPKANSPRVTSKPPAPPVTNKPNMADNPAAILRQRINNGG